MDTELKAASSHIKLALLVLREREKRLANTRSKPSRHWNRVRHTAVLVSLIEELQGVVLQDPDNWDDEPEAVPF